MRRKATEQAMTRIVIGEINIDFCWDKIRSSFFSVLADIFFFRSARC